jgi:peptide/nickel transport system substrate-binding protein
MILPDPAARLNALRSGEVDAAGFIAAEDISTLQDEGFTLVTNEAVHLGLHIFDREGAMVPEFANEQVRLALSHAIDRETLVEVVTSGYGEPLTQRFQAGQYGYAEDIADLTYDPEQARELLAEAGVESMEFSIPIAGNPSSELQAIAGLLQEVGITMNIESVAPGTLIQESAAGNWAAAILPIYEPHVATFVSNRVLASGFLNPFDIEEADLEELAEQARQLPPDEAEPLWADVTRETAERGIIIHLYAIPSLVFTSPQVQGGEVGYLQPNVLRLRGVTIED